MAEVTFLSNKTRKEIQKLIFVFIFAVITWILQLSVVSQFAFFDTTINLMFLGTVLFGLIFGPAYGIASGMITSFLCSCILYNHIVYISYPFIGLVSGLLKKSLFSDELLLYIILTFLLAFPYEFLNGWQFSQISTFNFISRYLLVSFYLAIFNLILAPFFYLTMNFLIKKLKLR